MQQEHSSFLVSVALADRVGILRDVTGALFAEGANFTDLRQSVVGGVFTLSAIAEFAGPADPAALSDAVRAALPGEDPCVDVRPCASRADKPIAGERYVVSATGPDSPGRIHRIAKVFADRGVNVEDWRHDFTDPKRTLTIGVVTVPDGCDLAALRASLAEALAPMGLSSSLLHENFFRATNEVGPIRTLLDPAAADASRNSAAAR